jgi:hypothetical protein
MFPANAERLVWAVRDTVSGPAGRPLRVAVVPHFAASLGVISPLGKMQETDGRRCNSAV